MQKIFLHSACRVWWLLKSYGYRLCWREVSISGPGRWLKIMKNWNFVIFWPPWLSNHRLKAVKRCAHAQCSKTSREPPYPGKFFWTLLTEDILNNYHLVPMRRHTFCVEICLILVTSVSLEFCDGHYSQSLFFIFTFRDSVFFAPAVSQSLNIYAFACNTLILLEY